MTTAINCIWYMVVWLLFPEKGYTSVNDSPEAIALSWEFSTTPVEITKTIDGKKLKPTAILTLDSTKVNAENLAALEEILYGKGPDYP